MLLEERDLLSTGTAAQLKREGCGVATVLGRAGNMPGGWVGGWVRMGVMKWGRERTDKDLFSLGLSVRKDSTPCPLVDCYLIR